MFIVSIEIETICATRPYEKFAGRHACTKNSNFAAAACFIFVKRWVGEAFARIENEFKGIVFYTQLSIGPVNIIKDLSTIAIEFWDT